MTSKIGGSTPRERFAVKLGSPIVEGGVSDGEGAWLADDPTR